MVGVHRLVEAGRVDHHEVGPAGLDESVDAYHEEAVPFYGGLRRMINRNDDGVVVFGGSHRKGEFRDGYGHTVKSARR
ncbi:hypothetical protein JHV675_52310 [Mycobacterium avium subsp. hominissuis]